MSMGLNIGYKGHFSCPILILYYVKWSSLNKEQVPMVSIIEAKDSTEYCLHIHAFTCTYIINSICSLSIGDYCLLFSVANVWTFIVPFCRDTFLCWMIPQQRTLLLVPMVSIIEGFHWAYLHVLAIQYVACQIVNWWLLFVILCSKCLN